MNAAEFLLGGVRDETRPSLLTLQGEYTYGELLLAIDQVSGFLRHRGVGRGRPVVLLADNSFFWVAAYFGILKSGCIAVPLAPNLDLDELTYILQSTQARVAFARNSDRLPTLLPPSSTLVLDDSDPRCANEGIGAAVGFSQLRTSSECTQEYVNVDSGDAAAIMFTSGSTGTPRGVVVSHGNITANTASIVQYLDLSAADRVMAVLPFYYCFGTSLLHTHLRVGGSVVIDHRFMFPDKVLQRMIETDCTGFAGVPSHYQILLRGSSIRRMQFPKLRCVQQAGGSLAAELITELRRALPTTKVFIMYGQTEATARLSYLPPELLDSKLGSIGKGIPGVELAVLNDKSEPVRPGDVGQIVARGANITLGYWQDPDETAATFRDGALYTGDLATVDADGFIFIVGRAKEFLKCGGNRVSCRRVEEMLLGFPDIIEVAVIGIPDELQGEAVLAFVVPRNGAEPDTKTRLAGYCAAHLPSHLLPKEIVVLRELPKNSAGKVARAVLEAGKVSTCIF